MSDKKKACKKVYAKRGRPVKRDVAALQHDHNSWEIVRSTPEILTVRCRECQMLAKVRSVARCEAFNSEEGCQLGEGCKLDHIHSHKMKLGERLELHGDVVLKKVPWASRPPPPLLNPDSEDDESTCEGSSGGETTTTGLATPPTPHLHPVPSGFLLPCVMPSPLVPLQQPCLLGCTRVIYWQ